MPSQNREKLLKNCKLAASLYFGPSCEEEETLCHQPWYLVNFV